MTRSIWIYAVLFAATLSVTAHHASANDVGSAFADEGGAVSDVAVAPPNDHWEGTIPEGSYQAISTDAALPLPIYIIGWSQTEETALSFVDVTVLPQGAAETVPGTLSYHSDYNLVLWQPTAPLAPNTTFTVSVNVDNEGLSALGFQPFSNITGSFEVTTGADALPLGALPTLDEPTISYTSANDWAACPSGEAICDASGICDAGVNYERFRINITLAWHDGEAEGQELFFTYNVVGTQDQSWLAQVAGADVLDSAHTRTLTPFPTATTEYCFEVEAIDLRAVAAGDLASGSRKVLRCVPLTDKPADEDPSAKLAACAPFDDVTDVTDVTDINNDTPDGSDVSSGDASPSGDDDGCGCTTTRTPQGQPPVGLLLGLAGAFGVALTLRRRSRRSRG